MPVKIEKKIVGYDVIRPGEEKEAQQEAHHPILQRPEGPLEGKTYKVKTPLSEHAIYVTINDIVDESGKRQPFEIFINSKNMEHFQWIVALTRVISAIFRKGGDVSFLVEELKSVFDPRGGYYKKGGRYMPSLVAEIGEVIEQHLVEIGMMDGRLATPELEAKRQKAREVLGEDGLKSARQCGACGATAVVRLDNCNVCLECGDSKCG